MGTRSGRDVDKFAETGLTPVPSEMVDAPYAAESPVAVECRVAETRETGIHLEIVADVVDIKAEAACLNRKGYPDFDLVRPLLFAPEDGLYHSLGPGLGRAFKMNPAPGKASPKQPVLFPHQRAHKLDDEERLALLSEETLVELLQLRGAEDIADLGSGTGFYTNRLAARTTGTVYAVELQPEMQEKHAVHGVPGNVELVLADARELPLGDESVDLMLSIYAFHEMPEAEGIGRAAAALRPGGRLLIVDWKRAEDATEHGPPLEVRHTREEVTELLRPYFSSVESGDIDRFLYWARGTK
ncbi:MAG: methyltransferase domain-containing protein [Gaiellales bacterium]|nr:methyltransferase domain-containing protein [Gaiellales bacterium]